MVFDHGTIGTMDSMPISKFKATCVAALERVRRTGRPLRVTRFGKPVADIVPPTPAPSAADWLGSMRGTAAITGDLMSPSSELADWDTLRRHGRRPPAGRDGLSDAGESLSRSLSRRGAAS